MRKSTKLISAGSIVAGLAVATAPLMAFAATPTRTDTLNVEVLESCTINTDYEIDDDLALSNTYDAKVEAGQQADFERRTTGEGASTTENTFVINCNYAEGYKIVANAEALVGRDQYNTDTSIPTADPATGTSFWAAKISTTGNLKSKTDDYKGLNTANFIVASNEKGSATGGDSFTVAYKVGAATELKAGNYKGTVAYTLVRGEN